MFPIGNSTMTDYQRSAGPEVVQHHPATWSDCLRMIAVTAEQLSTVSGSAENSGYVPTVPADSEDRRLD
jgi:hypothetical protein